MLTSLLFSIETPSDRNKFEKLYNLYEKLMLYIAYDILKDHHLAEDAVNDAFIKIIDNFDKISEIDCPQTKRLIVIIIRNTCFDIYRRQKRYKDLMLRLSDSDLITGAGIEPSAQDEYFQKFTTEELKAAIKSLSADQRNTLYCYAFCRMTINDVALLFGENPETIKKRIFRARKRLREFMENRK